MARPTLRRTGADQRRPAGQQPSRPARRPPPTPCVVTTLAHDRRTKPADTEATANRRRLTQRSEHPKSAGTLPWPTPGRCPGHIESAVTRVLALSPTRL